MLEGHHNEQVQLLEFLRGVVTCTVLINMSSKLPLSPPHKRNKIHLCV